jgi:riboflavin synthase
MFTGLIQKIGTVKRISCSSSLVVEIGFEPWPTMLEEGESVAVNGVCLTVARRSADRFTADVLDETASRSSLAGLVPGERVNLERALKASDHLGGHIVQGHVEEVGSILSKKPRGRDFHLAVKCSRVFAASQVLKGSVAIDGVSLTISELGDDFFAVDIIPTTAAETTLGRKTLGDKVNLEGDIIGKYVNRRIKSLQRDSPGLSEDALRKAGFL